ncbi:unnamed protein product [Paramecium sonneborni]|uniref:Uncharacterized protein n=1 Tax=Paramecium sonneborni TaxID=65129 RepID=A0A8S1RQB9_9CILI|nr:unnamed protein product [Paramecium sonneborni]
MSCQQSQNFEEYTIEKEFDTYNKDQGKIDKIKIHITFTSDYLLIKWNSLENQKAQMSLRNQIYLIIQIKFTIFHGKASIVKTKKNGQWNAFWNKQLLENVCGYYKEDLKQGLWKDLFKNYQSKAQIFEIGEYLNDFRIGRWNCICQYRKIGGGIYNKEGWKQGKWIEPDERIYDIKKVSYNGEYNMNNMKVGRWDIMYCKYDEKEYKQIIFKSTNVYSAGGSYDQEGNQRKVGKWVELDAGFYCFQYNSKQVTYNGEYNMNNMKVGRWDIMYCDRGGNGKYKQMQILELMRIFKYKYIQWW